MCVGCRDGAVLLRFLIYVSSYELFASAKLVNFRRETKLRLNPAAKLLLGYAIYLRSQVWIIYFAPITSDMSCLVRFSTIASQRRES